jgi:DNA-directed RNA polymerase sigma subunit (sigma70/sigma32)
MAKKTMRELLMPELTDREKEVLAMQFGSVSPDDVEEEFRATREQILAVEKRALEKLKDRK